MTWPTQTYTPQINANAILGSMDGWYNPAQTAAAVLPGAVAPAAMPTGADLSWAMPAQGTPFSYGMGGATPAGVTPTAPADTGGGFMNFMRGQQGVAGDGVTGWLGNGQNLGAVVQGIGALTNAYLGFRQLSMAKDQLNFQKSSWAKNFANSVSTYNTSLEDRIRGRTSDYAGKENDVQSYLAKHKLKG